MDYKKFSFRVVIRVLFIMITVLVSGYLFFKTSFYFTASFTLLIALLQSYWLMNLVNKTNRQLTVFLDSIKYAEFNRTFQPAGLGESFDGLSDSFNSVLKEFHSIRKEKEELFFFYQNVIQHIGISMLAYNSKGRIEMLNNSARKLFQVKKIDTIQNIAPFSNELVKILETIENNERKLIKVQKEDDFLQLSIHAKKFKLENNEVTIVSVQNIESELEQTEMEAWQKLIRVLTHEIMNSITPISSLSGTLSQMVKEWQKENFQATENDELGKDIHHALQTIQKRSDGLLNFVQTYRSLTKIPKPDFKIIKVSEFFDNLTQLMRPELSNAGIQINTTINPKGLEITADETMMEQVLINLVRNAIHAVEKSENKQIDLRAGYGNYGNINIQVIDYGQGILPEVLEKIFVPFFTTKQSGSGIGLSLSRQMVRAQGGNISAISAPGKTVFTIRF